jgi:hypothetical protein
VIAAGKHKAKLNDYGITRTSKGDLQIACLFDIDGQELTWFGSLKEGKAKEITMKTLVAMGFDELNQNLAVIAKGPTSQILNQEEEFSLTVEHDEYLGKTTARIRWVNSKSENALARRISYDEALAALTGAGTPPAMSDSFDDIPF